MPARGKRPPKGSKDISQKAHFALLGPTSLIAPKEEEIIASIFKGIAPNIEVIDCEGREIDGLVRLFDTSSILAGRRIVILRNFSSALFDKIDQFKKWLERSKKKEKANDVILLLESEAMPSAKKVSKVIEAFFSITDLSLKGLPQKERLKRAREIILEMAHDAGKGISEDAIASFFNMTSIEDAAFLKTEFEKVIASVGAGDVIRQEDVLSVLVETKQDAVYELTQAIGDGDKRRSYKVIANLIANGFHPLAILQVLSLWLRRLLILRLLFPDPAPSLEQVPFNKFKDTFLKTIGESLGSPLPYPLDKLKPYAIYSLWKVAMTYTILDLKQAIQNVAEFDLLIKTNPSMDRLYLEQFVERLLQ